jgi:hypothetical protein
MSNSQIMTNINASGFDTLDLEPIKFKLMNPDSSEKTAWNLEKADRVAELYIMFLQLCLLYPNKIISPSLEVDKFWHEHILDTHMYHKDCQNIFGYYLHHYPYFGIRGEQDKENLQSVFTETQLLYQLHFDVSLTLDCSETSNQSQCNAICGADYIKPQFAQCNAICGADYIQSVDSRPGACVSSLHSLDRPRPIRN